MKLFIPFLFSIMLNQAFAQTSPDTIQLLQNKAVAYLTKMYAEKNFDAGLQIWDPRMRTEAQNVYKANRGLSLDDTALTNQLRKDYTEIYAAYKTFEFTSFGYYALSTMDSTLFYQFEFTYKAGGTKNESIISLGYDEKSGEWKVLDMIPFTFLDRKK